MCRPRAAGRLHSGTGGLRYQVEDIQVTAIKQGLNLRNQPVTASVIGRTDLERRHVAALKEVSQAVPNFHIPDYGSRMTSSIYIRGLGARIDQPVMGLNIDNIPYLNKDAYDFDLTDIERIEVLRGPRARCSDATRWAA